MRNPIKNMDARAMAAGTCAVIVKWLVIAAAALVVAVAAFNFIQITGLALYDSWLGGVDSAVLAELIVATYLPCMAFVVIMVSVLAVAFMRAVWRAADGIAVKVRSRMGAGKDSQENKETEE